MARSQSYNILRLTILGKFVKVYSNLILGRFVRVYSNPILGRFVKVYSNPILGKFVRVYSNPCNEALEYEVLIIRELVTI